MLLRRLGPAVPLGAGLAAAASVPPFGWWVLGPAALAVLCRRLGGRSARQRLADGLLFGAGLYGVSLFWAEQFTIPGWVVMAGYMSVVTGLALVLVPPGRGRLVGFPAAVV